MQDLVGHTEELILFYLNAMRCHGRIMQGSHVVQSICLRSLWHLWVAKIERVCSRCRETSWEVSSVVQVRYAAGFY